MTTIPNIAEVPPLIQLSLPLSISLAESEVGTQSLRENNTGKEIFLKLILWTVIGLSTKTRKDLVS